MNGRRLEEPDLRVLRGDVRVIFGMET